MDGQTQIKLTPTSAIVLGLLDRAGGRATPYALKQMAATSVGNLWSVPHAQLYSEPERLARAGLVAEEREEGGRRRRLYTLTPAGRTALAGWLEAPTGALGELRDPGLLRLFLGAAPGPLAAAQLAAHEAKLAEYLALHESASTAMPDGMRLALEAGIAHERVWVAFWRPLADGA